MCFQCLLRGAAWNLSLPEPPSDQSIEEILDKEGREEFRKAVERDRTIGEAIVSDAKEKTTGGVLANVRPIAGESMTVTVEREATRILAEAKAKAPLQPGRLIPGIGKVEDAVWFEPAPFGRKRAVTAQIANVLIAETPTHYVARRAGRYYIFTQAGKMVASDDDLWLALLILMALAKRELDKQKERDAKRASASAA